jgi:TolA-binding protein
MREATTGKRYLLAFCLAVFSRTICAQQADPCAELAGPALDRCQVDQQRLQQKQQLTQQQQQLTRLQQQLAQQQQQLAQQQEQLRQQQEQLTRQQQQIAKQQTARQPEQPQQNEILSKQMEHERLASQTGAPAAADQSKRAELKSWRADNPWFGSDYAKTQFAMRYARQLQQERPDLVGRPFLDALSAKVKDNFGAAK